MPPVLPRRCRCRATDLPAAAALCLLFVSRPAVAHERDFPFTYDWFQPARREKEFELHSSYDRRGSFFKQEAEFEYGVSDRFAIAPYVVFEKPTGEKRLKYDAWKVETRYQLGNYAENRWLPGLYLEYENPHDAKGEVETKLILSRFDRENGDLTLNLIGQRVLETKARWETLYSLGYARGIGKNRARGGVEWIHELDTGRINAGPVAGFSPGKGVWVTTHVALPVTGKDDNRAQFRLLAEYEWF